MAFLAAIRAVASPKVPTWARRMLLRLRPGIGRCKAVEPLFGGPLRDKSACL